MNEILHSIVILEDDAGLRRAIERLLRLSGYGARSFESAQEAGAVACASSAACLIVDVQLPGVSGPDFYAALNAPRPPVVFITAYDNASTRRAVGAIGAIDAIGTIGAHPFLTKPFMGDALLEAVRRAVGGL